MSLRWWQQARLLGYRAAYRWERDDGEEIEPFR